MSTDTTLDHIAALASLDLKAHPCLSDDLTNIMNYIAQLSTYDTEGVEPLRHPLDIDQRLRPDDTQEMQITAELAAIAPDFAEGLYRVPQVVDTEV